MSITLFKPGGRDRCRAVDERVERVRLGVVDSGVVEQVGDHRWREIQPRDVVVRDPLEGCLRIERLIQVDGPPLHEDRLREVPGRVRERSDEQAGLSFPDLQFVDVRVEVQDDALVGVQCPLLLAGRPARVEDRRNVVCGRADSRRARRCFF
jgi:hypothetical protein